MKKYNLLMIAALIASAGLVDAKRGKNKRCKNEHEKKCHQAEGVLDSSFNRGGPKQGVANVALSGFLDLATDHILQYDKDDKCDYKIVVCAQGVGKPNLWWSPDFGKVNGGLDERVGFLVRLNKDGSIDNSFGDSGNGIALLNVGIFSNVNNYIFQDKESNIYVSGGAGLAPGADPRSNDIGITNLQGLGSPKYFDYCNTNCCFQIYFQPEDQFDPTTAPSTASVPTFFTSAGYIAKYTKDGKLDTNFGGVSEISLIDPIPGVYIYELTYPRTFGDGISEIFSDKDSEVIYTVGSTALLNDAGVASGCYENNALLWAIDQTSGAPTSFGRLVEPATNFVDLTNPANYPSNALNYAYYTNGLVGKYGANKDKIIVAGNADLNFVDIANDLGGFLPGTSRAIAARYNKDGSIDTTFGVNGYVVLSAANREDDPRQLLPAAIAEDKNGNLYIGGDSAPLNSGFPGATSPLSEETASLIARADAKFLIFKLDENGKPVDYGPASGLGTDTLTWANNDNTPSVKVISKHWQEGVASASFDDSCYDLYLDDACNSLTAVGQVSPDREIDSMNAGLIRYHLSSGEVDSSFGTGGWVVFHGGEARGRTLVRSVQADQQGSLVTVGQSNFPPTISDPTNSERTAADTLIARVK